MRRQREGKMCNIFYRMIFVPLSYSVSNERLFVRLAYLTYLNKVIFEPLLRIYSR